MSTPTIGGVCPILAVPFTKDGEVDLASFEALCDHVFSTGIRAATLFGLVSEFYKLTDAEREALTQVMLERAAAHPVVPVVSITEHAVESAVARATQLESAGVGGLNVLPPHFLAPGRAAVVAHLDAILAAVDVPVIAQYAPAQTGSAIGTDVWLELADRHQNLRYVKVEAHPPGPYLAALREASDGRIGGLVGYAGVQLPDALRRGASGVQPGCSFTELYLDLWARWERGEEDSAAELHRQLLPFITYWMEDIELIIAAEKRILAERGIVASAYCRQPRYELDRDELTMIDRFLAMFGGQLESPTA